MTDRTVFLAYFEATQSLDQMAGDLANRGVALAPIGRRKIIEQPGSGAGERDFQMERERIVIESNHVQTRTKLEH